MNSILRKALIALVTFFVVLFAVGAWFAQGNPTDRPISATIGHDPQIGDPEPERVPTVGIAKPIGWKPGEAPTAAAGLAVSRFAEGLNHPRTMLTLPNGDVLVAETNHPAEQGGGLFSWIVGYFQ